VLWQKEKFRKILSVAGYVAVPEAHVDTAAAIIPEVLQAHPGLKSISWVQPPKKVLPGQPGSPPTPLLPPPALPIPCVEGRREGPVPASCEDVLSGVLDVACRQTGPERGARLSCKIWHCLPQPSS